MSKYFRPQRANPSAVLSAFKTQPTSLSAYYDAYRDPVELESVCLAIHEMHRIINADERYLGCVRSSVIPDSMAWQAVAFAGSQRGTNFSWAGDSVVSDMYMVEKFVRDKVEHHYAWGEKQLNTDDLWRISTDDWELSFVAKCNAGAHNSPFAQGVLSGFQKLQLPNSMLYAPINGYSRLWSRFVSEVALITVTGDADKFVADMSILKIMN